MGPLQASTTTPSGATSGWHTQTVTCRVLKIARQPYYRWLLCPITDADLVEAYRANALFDAHRDDPEFGYRFLVDEAHEAGESMARADRVADLLEQRLVQRIRQAQAGQGQEARPAEPRRPVCGHRQARRDPSRVQRQGHERTVADRHHRAPHR